MEERRCTSDVCLMNASKRSFVLNLPVANILDNPKRDWRSVSAGKIKVASNRSLGIDWNEYCKDDYLFTHATIVASVATAKNGYHIQSPCDELVNNNGNAWTNEVLLSTFRSFVGGENYYEHVQVPELSKGKILDAVIR